MLEHYVHRIDAITRTATSARALRITLETLLAELLAHFDVAYHPTVIETASRQSLSQLNGPRADSLFGHVVLDYRAPRLLSTPRACHKARREVEDYLDSRAGPDHAAEPQKWAGILWDGASMAFCHSDGVAWTWSDFVAVSESSLLRLGGTYRALQRKPLIASLLAHSFGKDSEVAGTIIPAMCNHLSKPRPRTALQFRAWKRLFAQVSTYDLDPALNAWARSRGIRTRDAHRILFAIHSYYALVVKLLTSELLTAVTPHSPRSICRLLAETGTEQLCALLTDLEDDGYWRKFGITNFLEGDVFSWYADERSGQLASAVQSAAGALLCFEPATPLIKPDSVHDLLKEFYTTLVDEAIRHDLGEYYTPDWLAQRVLNAAGYTGDPHAGVLDPACGSGTFLVECINRIRRRATSEGMGGQEILSTLLHRVKGMDLNPLAVISARANFILSIADLVSMLGDGAELPIYLADCITVPLRTTATDDLAVLAFSLDTELGWYEFQIPANLIEAKRLREVLLACEDAVRQKRSAGSFLKAVRAIPGMPQLIDDRSEKRLVALFEIAASLEQPSGHRIWARIVNTSLSADGFVGQVDLLVGNAPWVRWSRLPRQYRERVKDFGKFYGLVAARGYSGGIEADISTLVLFSAADHWLKSGGRIGFLMTWSVFKSASAGGFRQGVLPNGTGLRMDGLADLRRVLPFPDATNETAIYVATKVAHAEAAAFEQVSAETWLPKNSARIDPRSSLDDALDAVDVRESVACPVGGWGSPLWTGETREFQESRVLRGCSAYLHRAHRGTVTDLARVYWVKVERYAPDSGRALIRTLSNAELARAQKIDPVEGAWIEAELLFPLIRGRDLGRYCFRTNDFYQLIPNAHYESVLEEEVFAEKYPCAYAYLSNYRDLLVRRATYQRYQAHLPFYVIYCIGSYSFRQWKLAWMEQQDPAAFRCAVISDLPSSVIPNRRIIADHKLYFADLDTGEEAHYLAAFLNSHPVRTWLGGFLHAKQIATSIFEFMHVPRYDETDADHRRLAALSLAEHGRRAQALNTEYLAPDSESELADLVRRVADRAR